VFFFIEDDFSNISIEALQTFQFIAPDVSDYNWNVVFEEMCLQKILKG